MFNLIIKSIMVEIFSALFFFNGEKMEKDKENNAMCSRRLFFIILLLLDKENDASIQVITRVKVKDFNFTKNGTCFVF